MQTGWQFPLGLKQTQVSPLPIQWGEPYAVSSAYNQSEEFLIQTLFSFSQRKSQITNILLYHFTKQVIKQCGREEQEEENFNSVHCRVLARQAKKEKWHRQAIRYDVLLGLWTTKHHVDRLKII